LGPGGGEHFDKTRDGHKDLNQENHGLSAKLVRRPGTSEKDKNVADSVGGWQPINHGRLGCQFATHQTKARRVED
jgi:hypothetical protein